ncbi:hypothetical protein DVH24_001811 [Malus domestica]|uniref:Uncharacterized protein n=1 Tax=Malus domestica TaxID=3750 RepID=A0A498IAX8_MALDO|nr:hypothetical protein DVH24_001811 [Malus domestica]
MESCLTQRERVLNKFNDTEGEMDTVEERMRQVQARMQRMIAGALTNEEEFDLPELRSSKYFSPRSLY